MPTTQHTPGPWHVDRTNDWNFLVCASSTSLGKPHLYPIPVAASIYDPMTEGSCEANARLIAASPDLLAALMLMTESQERIRDIGSPYCGPLRLSQARSAIAKAQNAEGTPQLSAMLPQSASSSVRPAAEEGRRG